MPLEGSSTSSSRRFCISELGQDLYLGEMDNDTPDGFGLTVEEDGKIVYGMMKDGIRQGIGMICYDADMWEVGKWTEGNFKSFNNSRISQAKLEAFKRDNREYRKEMRGMLLETTFNLAQVGLDIAASVKGNNSQGTAGTGDAGGGASVASGKSQSYYQTLYNKWEQKAKNTFEDRVRHKVSAETYGDGRVASSDAKLLRQYQSSMRSVRMAAKRKGLIFLSPSTRTFRSDCVWNHKFKGLYLHNEIQPFKFLWFFMLSSDSLISCGNTCLRRAGWTAGSHSVRHGRQTGLRIPC